MAMDGQGDVLIFKWVEWLRYDARSILDVPKQSPATAEDELEGDVDALGLSDTDLAELAEFSSEGCEDIAVSAVQVTRQPHVHS